MNPKAIISVIIEKIENGQRKVFFQTRWKPEVSPAYSGMLEIPAGGIEAYEDVYEAIKREVFEETGLTVVSFINDYHGEITENRPHDRAKVFKPFLCQEMLETVDGLPWIGFVFRCEATGVVNMQESEAKDPIWLTVDEIKEMMAYHPEKIFPLQFPVLQYYIKNI